MPADSRLKALAHEIELERRHALDLSPAGEEEEDEEFDELRTDEPGEGGGFAVLSSGAAELDDAIMSETALQLFPTEDPKPAAKKSIAFTARSPTLPPSRPRARARVGLRDPERLRGERSRMVGDLARRSGKSHREIQARINRETKVKSVANATIDQLERGNEILRRDLSR